ncbi:MAG: TonB-dependent receptor [Betaproteobacteria bacterium]
MRRGNNPALVTRLASGGLVLGVAMSAAGQQEAMPVVTLEKVEVTGSNIRRIERESGLPVQIITRDELINGGVQTAQELLERISANQPFGGWNETKGEGSTLVGFTAASLRGLGSQRTLVLLNGRRVAPYALSGGASVDLSAIPASALERVEILKDGASAVYGTDAIGGVLNFILRKDFIGAEVNTSYFATEQGGGNNGRINITAGFGNLAGDRYNVFVSADYFGQDSLRAAQRESTRTAYLPWLGVDNTSSPSFPANIIQPNGFNGVRNPTIPASGATSRSCLPPISFPTEAFPLQCRFDFASVSETIPEVRKTNVIARFTWQIAADHQFFVEGSRYGGNFIQRISPTPVSRNANTPMTLPPTSPFYPAAYIASLPGGNAARPVQLAYRTVELGPRVDEARTDQWRAVLGLQGTFKSWDYVLAANYTANRQIDNYQSGWLYEPAFGPLLRSGVINPFGYNTSAVLEQMRATQITGQANDNRASNFGGDFKVASTLYELPSGPVALALGLEGCRESLEQTNADFVVSGDVIGGAGAVPSLPTVHRAVWSLFSELNVPVVKSLEINLAARYDHYSDFAGTTNPKITLRWQPRQEVLLRAAYGTGFRAPTLSDVLLPPVYSVTADAFDDPLRCPVTQSEIDCVTNFRSQGVGNPQLQPEKSKQASAGVVLEPVSGLSLSVDYFRVEIRNLIQILPAREIFGNYASWAATHVVRKPPDTGYPDLPGEIAYVIENQINIGTLQTSGLDVELRWRAPATPVGSFTLGLTGTYIVDYTLAGINSNLFPSGVGTRGPDGPVSRWRHYATLNWNYGAWAATVANTFQSGYGEVDLTTCTTELNCPGTRRVGAYSTWDLQGRHTGYKNLTLMMGVRNVLATSPPVSNQANTFQVGIDPGYADPRGRMFYGAVRYAFK